jgi:mannose-1-phosphate guanylyltransferase/mannose-6-phosphate isomerase
MSISIQPVILSGGSGTRLWPYSREAYPKQFLSFVGQNSLLQETAVRVGSLDDFSPPHGYAILPPLVICNELHRFLVAEQLREAGYDNPTILLEPSGRNTAPAVTLAALECTRTQGADPVLVITPSDHHVEDLKTFRRNLADAITFAADGKLVTFGIVPDRPETGYGYIRKGDMLNSSAFMLSRFVEKPDLQTAIEYLNSRDYLWNSGLFIMRASVWLEQIRQFRPDIADCCQEAFTQARREADFIRVDKQAFQSCPSDSIDYAVMERLTAGGQSERAVVIPLSAGWSDLGSWSAVSELNSPDGDGNVVHGDVFVQDSHDSLLYSQGRFLAALGVEHLIVVETTDAVLVAHKDKAQEIKAVTEHLKQSARQEHIFHTKVHRPWGSFESIDRGIRYQVKRLNLSPGATLSLQLHHHRAEHWIVVKGTARVTRGDETFLITENESTYIPVGVKHRLENPGAIPLELIEVQSGSYLGEDDIVRFDDKYLRVETH